MRTRLLAPLAALALSTTLIAADTAEVDGDAATETLFISAGCPQDTPGTCTSTRWLGRVSGDASSNFLTATTPVNEVQFVATGALQWRDYPSDLSLREDGYLLDVDRDLEIDVLFTTNGVSVNNTVHLRASLNVCDVDAAGAFVGCTNTTLTAPTQTYTTAGPGDEVVEFALDLPDTMAGRTLRRLTVELANHGVNAQGSYIDQQGGSPVRIPHLLAPA